MTALIDLLNAANNSQINLAGPRYTPGQDSNAPNLRVEGPTSVLDFLCLSAESKSEILDASIHISSAWKQASPETVKFAKGSQSKWKACCKSLERLATSSGNRAELILKQIRKVAGDQITLLQKEQYRLHEQDRQLKDHTEESRKIRAQIDHLRKLQDPYEVATGLANSLRASALGNKNIFLQGEWGTGKTHLMCDYSKHLINRGVPVLLVLAHKISDTTDPLDAYVREKGIASSLKNLLSQMNLASKAKNCRGLIMVDGVNEGDRKQWTKYILHLEQLVSKYKYLGLVISCRSPFQKIMFRPNFLRKFVEVEHRGFDEIEFDAQLEFFSYHDLPVPQFPLLSNEFSRPLFLKIICESLESLGNRVKTKRWKEITSGQKSFTYILESFVKRVGQDVDSKFSLEINTSWHLIKGKGNHSSIAKIMAESGRNYLRPPELDLVVRQVTGLGRQKSKAYILALKSAGLISEDIEWVSAKPYSIYRLPYEKFSDHIIARHLLSELKTTSLADIRRQFQSGNALGRIFEPNEFGNQYVSPSLAEALILEFPERVKGKNDAPKELHRCLPQEQEDSGAHIDPFIDGLYWRSKESFSDETEDYIKRLFREYGSQTSRKTLEAITSVATRADHPWNAEFLFSRLTAMSMFKRDMFWSEFIRQSYQYSAVRKILRWLNTVILKGMTEVENLNILKLCSLFLVSSDRALRDRYSEQILKLGYVYPNNLFKHTLRCFDFNDPYVIERMLAVCYGFCLNRNNEISQNQELQSIVRAFSVGLFNSFFRKGAKHYTSHHLIRDYAGGIIDITAKLIPNLAQEIKISRAQPPFRNRSKIPPANKIRASAVNEMEFALGLDFSNYTMGRLIKNRANYDFKSRPYKDIRKRLLWRLKDLGLRQSEVVSIDREIQNRHWQRHTEPGKTDRYGKKYCWIAYFELYGDQQDRGALEDHRMEERCSDCDIDPTFPDSSGRWQVQIPRLIDASVEDLGAWLQSGPDPKYDRLLNVPKVNSHNGPWVMLEGYINETKIPDPREVFTFIRGIFIKANQKQKLKRILRSTEYPGNDQIPEPTQSFYVFAGEIPLSSHFLKQFKSKNGRARRTIGTCFDHGRYRKKRVKIQKAWFALEGAEAPSFNFVNAKNKRNESKTDSTTDDLFKLLKEANKGLPRNEQINFLDLHNPPTEDEFRKGYRLMDVKIETQEIKVEIPAHTYSFESYHSEVNKVSGITFPAPSILERLKLKNTGANFEYCDSKGNLAAFYVDIDSEGSFRDSHALFLRQDLLKRYLKMTSQEMVWIIWGERSIRADVFQQYQEHLNRGRQSHGNIHKKLKSFRT